MSECYKLINNSTITLFEELYPEKSIENICNEYDANNVLVGTCRIQSDNTGKCFCWV